MHQTSRTLDICLKEGSVDEAYGLERQIPEFPKYNSIEEYESGLKDKKHLILIAEENGENIGFKVGYELDSETFYSWIGGVLPRYRRCGIAIMLMLEQEAWAMSKGYERIMVNTYNCFPKMISMLSNNGYSVVGFDEANTVNKNRIHFSKELGYPYKSFKNGRLTAGL